MVPGGGVVCSSWASHGGAPQVWTLVLCACRGVGASLGPLVSCCDLLCGEEGDGGREEAGSGLLDTCSPQITCNYFEICNWRLQISSNLWRGLGWRACACAPVGQRLSFKCPGQKELWSLASSRKQTRFSDLRVRNSPKTFRSIYWASFSLLSSLCSGWAGSSSKPLTDSIAMSA